MLARRVLQQHVVAARAASRSTQVTKAVSCMSTWVAPTHRARHAPVQRRRQPHLINGQAIPLHVRDLKSTSSSSLSSSSSNNRSSFPSHNHRSPQQPKREYDSDLVVVLDLDECLIHSRFLNNPQQAAVYAHQLKNYYNENEDQQANVESFRIALQDDTAEQSDAPQWVHVHCRPGVVDFLTKVTSKYETHIFTAAMEVYAKPVLDELTRRVRQNTTQDESDEPPVFSNVFYRQDCSWDPMHQAYVKDLSKLPHELDLTKCILVDNNPNSFLTHANNGILVNSFYTNPNDQTLSKVWDVLQQVDEQVGKNDVRHYLSQRFGLQQALERKCPKSLEESSVVHFGSTTTTTQQQDLAAAITTGSAAAAAQQQAVACA